MMWMCEFGVDLADFRLRGVLSFWEEDTGQVSLKVCCFLFGRRGEVRFFSTSGVFHPQFARSSPWVVLQKTFGPLGSGFFCWNSGFGWPHPSYTS